MAPRDPTINHYYDMIRPPLEEAIAKLVRDVQAADNQLASRGLTGASIQKVLDLGKQHFDANVLQTFREMERFRSRTNFDRTELMQITVQELTNFLNRTKAVIEPVKRHGNSARTVMLVDGKMKALDQSLQLKAEQMDVGLLDLSQPGLTGVFAEANPHLFGRPIHVDLGRDSDQPSAVIDLGSLKLPGSETPVNPSSVMITIPGVEAKGTAGGTQAPLGATGIRGRAFDPNVFDSGVFQTGDDGAAARKISEEHRRRNFAAIQSSGSTEPPWPPAPAADFSNLVISPATPVENQQPVLRPGTAAPSPGPAPAIRVLADAAALDKAETLTRALSRSVSQEIERIKKERRNDPDAAVMTDFLTVIAAVLDQIAAAIGEARAASSPAEKEEKLVRVESLAESLAESARGFAQRNHDRIVDFGGNTTFVILSTSMLGQLFGLSPDVAFGGALALLGISTIKK